MKRTFAGLIISGVMLSAGAAYAESVAVPSAANEFSVSVYRRTDDMQARTGAAQPVYPSTAMEHGSAGENRVEPRGIGQSPSIGSTRSAFPTSANEVL